MRLKLANRLSVSILLVTISSVNAWTSLPIGNTFVWWILYAFILYCFYLSRNYFFDKSLNKKLIFVYTYIVWNIICILRGCFVADNYWEWKNLVSTSFVLLLPISVFVTTNEILIQRIIGYWFKYGFFLFFALFLFFTPTAYGRFLIPITFLALLFPYLNTRWKLVVAGLTVSILFVSLASRSNVIKFVIPFVFCGLYVIKGFLSNRLLSMLSKAILLLPILLFFLASLNVFNIFKMEEYLEDVYSTTYENSSGEMVEENLIIDTRTDLYIEVIESAIKNNYVFLGRTPARGNDSVLFGEYLAELLNIENKERFSNEVSILNIFTWTGLVGVLLYFLVFYYSASLAINESRNFASKILGLYISFRWAYGWVEDFSLFDLSNFFLWIVLGLCTSTSFRNFNDLQIKYWVRGIFEKKYRELAQRYKEYLSKQRNKEALEL